MAAFWQYAALASHVYSDSPVDDPSQAYFVPEGFTVVSTVSSANGLFARAYREIATGKIIVAVRGTEFTAADGPADVSTDINLALGIDASGLGPTQVTDLADFVADLIIAEGKENVEITGHSLGGGLAAIMVAFFDINGFGFNPAPFAEYLSGDELEANALSLIVNRLKALFPVPDEFSNAVVDIAEAFGNWIFTNTPPTTEEMDYISRVSAKFQTGLMAGELLQMIGAVLPGFSEPFPTASETIYQAANTLYGTFSSDPADLHSIDLLVLAIKTSTPERRGAGGEWSARPLDGAVTGDGLIRGNADVARVILSDKLSLPNAENGGWTALFRWWANDIELYSRNWDALETLMQKGAAADGFSASTVIEESLHGALVDLGFSIIRDGLDEGMIEQQARDAFWIDDRTDLIQLDLRGINVASGPLEQRLENGRHSATAAIDKYVWDAVSRSFNGGIDNKTEEVVEQVFETTRAEIVSGDATVNEAQVITVQAGADVGGITYQLTDADTQFSQNNIMIGGDAENTLQGGAGNDVLIGGAADDVFYLSPGKDVFVGGGGSDQYIADPDFGGFYYIFGSQGAQDQLIFGENFAGRDFTLTLENIAENSFDGVRIDAGDVGDFTIYDIREIVLSDGVDTIVRNDQSSLNTRINYGTGNATVSRVVSSKQPGDDNDDPDPSLIIHNFDVADSATAQTRTFSTQSGFADAERSNDIITLDGTNQLIGGISFDFEVHDYVYSETARYYAFANSVGFDGVLEGVALQRNAFSVFMGWIGFGFEVGSLVGLAGTAARNPALSAMGPVMGLGFMSIGVIEYGRMILAYKDATDRRYFGIHGEEYVLGRDNGDGTSTLTIIVDPDDTQARQEIIIENWKQGDFGITLDIAARGQGADAEVATWRTGSVTPKDEIVLSDEYIRGLAAQKGFTIPDVPPPPPPPESLMRSFSRSATEPQAFAVQAEADGSGIVRIGNESDNRMGGSDGRDVFDGGAGNDILYGGDGYDAYVFEAGDGADVIFDASPEGNLIRFRDGVSLADLTFEDVLGDNGATDRVITYGNGDTIRIKNWSDMSAATQNAWGFEELAPDPVQPTDINDVPDLSTETPVTTGTAGNDQLLGDDRSELFNGYAGDDLIDGAGGADEIVGGDGNDTIFGGGGRDKITGSDGNDILVGGIGRDLLIGGAGNDTYIFELGDGTDTIYDAESATQPYLIYFGDLPDVDRLRFGAGINPSDILITRDPSRLDTMTLTIGLTGEQIILADQYKDEERYGSNGLEFVEFADGTIWSRADMESIYLAQNITDGDDAIIGTLAGETLNGGLGDDHLVGAGGNDTYLWTRGSGNDRITDVPQGFEAHSANRLVFGAGIDPSDVTVFRQVADRYDSASFNLILTISGPDGGQVTVDQFFQPYDDGPAGNGVEVIVFADGTVWDRNTVYLAYLEGLTNAGDNSIEGTPGADVIDGGIGDDRIIGSDGNDVLIGNAGNDRVGYLFFENGDDTLIGGAGNDTLQGGSGSDTYYFGADFGHDTMTDGLGAGDVNRVVFTHHTLAQMSFVASGDEGLDLRIATVDGNSLFIKAFEGRSFTSGSGGWYENRWQNIAEFEFADGQVVNALQVAQIADIAGDLPQAIAGSGLADTMVGTDARDRLNGQDGDDNLSGAGGADYLAGGAGDDSISAGNGDDFVIGEAGADTLAGDDGDDLLFGGEGADVVAGNAGADYLSGGSDADVLFGGAGNDLIEAGAGNDTLYGGRDRDTLYGGSGDDTYVFNFGDGRDVIDAGRNRGVGEIETLILGPGLTQAMIRPVFDGTDLILTFANGTADQLTLRGFLGNGELNEIRFDNGTSLTAQEFLETITGSTSGDDVPTGSALGLNGERIQYGGRGNDFLPTLFANTIYVFGKGDGQDRMYAREGSFLGSPFEQTLVIRGYTEAETIVARGGPENDDLIISFTTGPDTMTVINHFGFAGIYADDELDVIQFGDGTRWNERRIAEEVLRDTGVGSALAETLTGTAADETLAGGGGSDTYVWLPNGGNDRLSDTDTGTETIDRLVFGLGVAPQDVVVSRNQNDLVLSIGDDVITLTDQLAGDGRGIEEVVFKSGDVWSRGTLVSKLSEALATVGDDDLAGSAADETLTGGQGDDNLAGGAGSDTYLYRLGDGNDTLLETVTSGTDKLVFDATVDQTATALRRDVNAPNDLLIDLQDGATIRVVDQFTGGGVEQLRFADGTYLSRDAIAVRTLADSQTAGDDLLVGTNGVDILRGGAGADVMNGAAGADYYAYTAGDGFDEIADTGATGDNLVFGPDIHPADVIASRDGDDLVFAFANSPTDGLRVRDHFAGQPIVMLQFTDGTLWDQNALDTLAGTGQLPDVLPDPVAPIDLGGLAPQLAREDEAFSFDVPADVFVDPASVTAAQADGSDLPAWLTFENGSFTGTPREEDVALIELTLSGNGPDGQPLTQSLIIGVAEVNDAPVAAGAISNVEVVQYADFTLDLSTAAITDADDALLYYTLQLSDGSNIPGWMTFDPTTLTLTGRPQDEDVSRFDGYSDYNLQLVAEDDAGLRVAVDFVVRALPEVAENTITGTTGNDTLTGGSYSDDVLVGGLGNDILRGMGGRDVYVFDAGDGADVIDADFGSRDAANGVIRFGPGIAPDDVILTRSGYTDTFNFDYWNPDLTITFAGQPGDSISIAEQFYGLNNNLPVIMRMEFDDGTVWGEADITARTASATGQIVGSRGDETLVGTTGNDTLIGLQGKDTLDGGAGDDLLTGGDDDDTYYWGYGSGHDILRDINRDSGSQIISIDRLKFGAGIALDDLTFTVPDSSLNSISAEGRGTLVIGLVDSPNDTLTIDNQYMFQLGRSFGIDFFEFDDGTVLTLEEFDFAVNSDGLVTGTAGVDRLVGTTRDEILSSGAGDDTMQGGLGDDVYVWNLGDGNDTIFESDDRSFDVLQFGVGITPEDLVLTRPRSSGNELSDLFIEVLPTGERLHIDEQYQVSLEEFAPGSNEERLVLVPVIDEIRFADGTIWNYAFLRDQFLTPTVADQSIIGYEFRDDTLDGGAGNDTLDGMGGDDVYIWGPGYGDDTIVEDGPINIFEFDTNVIRFVGDLTPDDLIVTRVEGTGHAGIYEIHHRFTIAATGESLLLATPFNNGRSTYVITFEQAGVTWGIADVTAAVLKNAATPGDDVFIMQDGFETADLGAGDDRIVLASNGSVKGGTGSDSYENGTYPETNVTIFESADNPGDVDILYAPTTRQPDQIVVQVAANGRDLLVSWSSYEAPIVLIDMALGTPGVGIEQIVYADNTVQTGDWLRSVATPANTTALVGTATSETLTTVPGTTTVIDGLAGADRLEGSTTASDIYVWRAGSGNDVIDDALGGNYFSATDTLLLEAVNQADVILRGKGALLEITHVPTGEIIRIEDQFAGSRTNGFAAGIEQVIFADGRLANRAEIMAATRIEGTVAGEQINGTTWDETFVGGAGDDVIYSGGSGNDVFGQGSDTYLWTSGDGNDIIVDRDSVAMNGFGANATVIPATDTLVLTDLNRTDIELSRFGTADLLIRILATGGTIRVIDQYSSGYSGTAGIERLVFANGDQIVGKGAFDAVGQYRGTNGNDRIYGGAADDTLIGGAGNDTLYGDRGDDIYQFGAGDGRDIIIEEAYNSGVDTIRFGTGIDPSQISLGRTGDTGNLVVTYGTGDVITVLNHFARVNGEIGQIVFDNGVIWDGQAIIDVLNGADGSDQTITGGAGPDQMNGGGGTDLLRGLGGADTYLFMSGDGDVTITDGGTNVDDIDMLQFGPGIVPADVSVARSGDDIILTIAGGGSVTLSNRLVNVLASADAVRFDDGTYWDFQILLALSDPNAGNTGPVAVDDIFATEIDTVLTLTPLDLLGNDTDPDGDTLSLFSVNSLSGGVAEIVEGEVLFTPADGFSGIATFLYVLRDSAGNTDAGTVSVTVGAAINAAPVAVADAANLAEDGTLLFDAVANDTDADGDTLTVIDVTGAQNGTTTVEAGQIRYTPNANFNGIEVLTYVVSDGNGATASGSLTVTVDPVNDAPNANDDTIAVTEGDTVVAQPTLNDSDVDSDTLGVTAIDGIVINPGGAAIATQGLAITMSATGVITFAAIDPFGALNAGEQDVITLIYTLSDGQGGTDTGNIAVTVTGIGEVSAPPVDGTPGNDTIDPVFVDAQGDSINDLGQTILAGDGDDYVYDGTGNDFVFGGAGRDRFYAGDGADAYDGGDDARDEVLYLLNGSGLVIDAQDAANSTGIAAGDTFAGIERIQATHHDDVIVANDAMTYINGRRGDDLIVDAGGATLLRGDLGADTFRLVAGDNALDRINDFTIGEDIIDLSLWGTENLGQLTIIQRVNANGVPYATGLTLRYGIEMLQLDNLTVDDIPALTAASFIFGTGGGGFGDGTINGTEGADVINVAFVDVDGDHITDSGDLIAAGAGRDRIFDGAGDDTVFGGADSDQMFAGAGADAYDGGEGTADEVIYQYAPEGLTLDMVNVANSTGIAAGDTFVNVERVRGSDFDDIIIAADFVWITDARAGDDLLVDGAGLTSMKGGSGADTFRLIGGDGARDRIIDFTIGTDILDLSGWGARALGDLTITEATNGAGDPLGLLYVTYRDEAVELRGLSTADIATFTGASFVFDDSPALGDGTVNGTDGDDIIDAAFTDAQGDFITNTGQLIVTGHGRDYVYDGAGDDTVVGGSGYDRFYAGDGADSYDGGGGNADEVNYQFATTGLTIDMTDALSSTGFAYGDTFVNVERIRGSNFDDIIIVTGSTMVLNANKGNDLIIDGDGLNILRGGSGADTFRFIAGDGKNDRVSDMTIGEDLLDISAWGATGIADLVIAGRTNSAGDPLSGLVVSYQSESLTLDKLGVADIANLSDSFIFA